MDNKANERRQALETLDRLNTPGATPEQIEAARRSLAERGYPTKISRYSGAVVPDIRPRGLMWGE